MQRTAVIYQVGVASVLTSDVPVAVQHSRLDSREPALALLTTIAGPAS